MRFILFLSLFTLLPFSLVFAQEQIWRRIRGVADTQITSIGIYLQNPDVLYLGSNFIYKSIDGGRSWSKVFAVPGMGKVNFLQVQKDLVYAGTEKGLFLSKDGGETWRRVFKGKGEANNVLSFAQSRSANLLYLGTQRGLFKSRNGQRWRKIKGRLSEIEVYQVQVDLENPEVAYALTEKGLFSTEDGGRNWKRLLVSFAEEEKEKERRLKDLEIGLEGLYLGGKDCLLKSTDKGKSWEEWRIGLLSGVDIRSLALEERKRILYLGTDKGVFKLSLGEQECLPLHQGLSSLDIRKIVLARGSLYAITKKGVFQRKVEEKGYSEEKVSWERRISRLFAYEPTIQEVQEKAIEYAEVHPQKIKRWRRLSARRAILPKLSIGVNGAKNRTLSDSIWGSSSGKHHIGPDDKTVDDNLGWDVSLTWELGDLIWNSEQVDIDTRSRLMVQLREDILDEVTRTYFERKRVKIDLFLSPPADEKKRIEQRLKLEELTANLDALTGGWFSREIRRRNGRR